MPDASPLRLHNSLRKREEEFFPLEAGKVRMYTCGPTVYGRPHIGNYASFLTADLLRRWLECKGFHVTHVKNITDVGHMVADRDSGEDKVEAQAKKEKQDPLAIARKYEEQYLEDERALAIKEPAFRPRATETIPEMIALIEVLLEKGAAYETGDGIYFSVQSFPAYGKLSGNTLDKLGKLEEGVRVDLSESKGHPADFALWKKRVGEHAEHILHWPSPWGDGFPGWHIECSAMSMKFLGPQVDIHTGGEDNIFPHHECEIAQSEIGTGKHPFVKYWIHRRRVNFAAEGGGVAKMSKSLGNTLTLPDIVARGFHPLDLRYFLLSSHYRSHSTFTWKGLEDARKARVKIVEWIGEMRREGGKAGEREGRGEKNGETQKWIQGFTEAMDADLNTPEALAVVFEAMAWSRNERAVGAHCNAPLHAFLGIIEETFGCFAPQEVEVPLEIQKLVSDREAARRAGDYGLSDGLRKEILAKGFILEDAPGGTKVVPRERRPM